VAFEEDHRGVPPLPGRDVLASDTGVSDGRGVPATRRRDSGESLHSVFRPPCGRASSIAVWAPGEHGVVFSRSGSCRGTSVSGFAYRQLRKLPRLLGPLCTDRGFSPSVGFTSIGGRGMMFFNNMKHGGRASKSWPFFRSLTGVVLYCAAGIGFCMRWTPSFS